MAKYSDDVKELMKFSKRAVAVSVSDKLTDKAKLIDWPHVSAAACAKGSINGYLLKIIKSPSNILVWPNSTSELAEKINNEKDVEISLLPTKNLSELFKKLNFNAEYVISLEDISHIVWAGASPEWRKSLCELNGAEIPDEESILPRNRIILSARKIKDSLKSKILGQENAVDTTVLSFLSHTSKNLDDSVGSKRPGCLLYIGASGVGKTFLAKELKATFERFGEEWEYQYINMSRYSTPGMEDDKLLGYGGRWQGGAKKGELIGPLKRNPKCIFVLDEIDRGSPEAMQVLLEVLEEGKAPDKSIIKGGKHPMVDTSQAVFIFTTNSGKDLYEDSKTCGFYGDVASVPRHIILKTLDQSRRVETGKSLTPSFPKAFLDRVKEFAVFNKLSYDSLVNVSRRELSNIEKTTSQVFRINKFTINDRVASIIVLSSGVEVSARSIFSQIEAQIEQPLFRILTGIDQEQQEDINEINIQVDAKAFFERVFSYGRKVLLIEDEKGWQKAVISASRDLFEVTVAESPQIARNYLDKEKKKFDWIMLDLNFEGNHGNEEGLDYLKELRRYHSNVPVYIFSRDISDEEDPLYYDCIRSGGAAGYVAKKSTLCYPKEGDDEYSAAQRTFKDKLKLIAEQVAFETFSNNLLRRGRIVTFQARPRVNKGKFTLILGNVSTNVAPTMEDAGWFNVEIPSESFDDVMGLDDVKEEMQLIGDFLKNPSEHMMAGAFLPKGYLFYGPPGTGKTLLGRAIANKADCPFIYCEASKLQKKHFGESSGLVRELFAKARKYSPVVIFIDELDAIGRRGDRNVDIPLINSLLTEIDGFKDSSGIVVIGATNRKDALDEALIRPGRLGKHYYIGNPRSKQDRENLLLYYMKHPQFAGLHNKGLINHLVRLTVNLSPAQIKELVYEAAWLAFKKGCKQITTEIILDSRNNVVHGQENRFQSEDENELTRVAYHEAGHAITSKVMKKPFIQISIVARDNSAGFVEPAQDENKLDESRDDLISQIVILLAGREAEKRKYGQYYSGAAQDLHRAKKIASYMVLNLGMTENNLPPVINIPNKGLSEEININKTLYPEDVRKQIEGILDNARKKALEIIDKEWQNVETLAQELLEKKTIFDDDLQTS